MKKKTVITTEKREVWVIRQAPNEVVELESDDAGDSSLTPTSGRDEFQNSNSSPEEIPK